VKTAVTAADSICVANTNERVIMSNTVAEAQSHSADDNPSSSDNNVIDSKNLFSNHKTELAIGAAAVLGAMVFYGWREMRIAKKNPEEYARLRKFKAVADTENANAGQ
jgi:hypothetical protein